MHTYLTVAFITLADVCIGGGRPVPYRARTTVESARLPLTGGGWLLRPFKQAMNTNATSGKESNGIDSRTKKAAVESMSLDAYAGETGEYDVYAESGEVYRVCLITESCSCPDYEYNTPEGGCKHFRRVEMEIGQRSVPDLGRETDVEMMIEARADQQAAETDQAEVVTDGGVAVESGQTATQDRNEARITGPWTEPADQGGANYWKCSECGRESLRRGDLEDSAFHASGCSLR